MAQADRTEREMDRIRAAGDPDDVSTREAPRSNDSTSSPRINEVRSRGRSRHRSRRIDRTGLEVDEGNLFPVAVVIGSSTLRSPERRFGSRGQWRNVATPVTEVARFEDAHDLEAVSAVRDRRDAAAAASDEVRRFFLEGSENRLGIGGRGTLEQLNSRNR
jgi:hypothetical protein